MNLNYKIVGDKNSTQTIIFLHEGLGCVEMWKDYPQKLCQQLGINGIVYDRAGYGKSPGSLLKRNNQYLHDAAIELKEFLSFLKIKNPILYGHSDGGSIALIYAAQNKVKAIITEAAHVFNEPETIEGVKKARPLLALKKMDGLQKYHGDRYQEVFYAWNDIWLDPSFEKWNISEDLPKISAPQLVIQGKDDEYGTLKQVDTIKALTTGKTTILTPANCGHAPFKEHPNQILEFTSAFINEIK